MDFMPPSASDIAMSDARDALRENKSLREQVAALERRLAALESWAESHQRNNVQSGHQIYGGGSSWNVY